jgi:hypothetical protein
MHPHYTSNERELVRLITFFKKENKKLLAESKLDEQRQQVEETADKFMAHLEQHVQSRALILEQREALQKLVRDDATCPKCSKKDMLKLVGTEKNEKGWKSNRYRCRRCNIAFTWNRPNNPWDMMAYTAEMLAEFTARLEKGVSEEEKQVSLAAMQNARVNLEKIKPVIDAHEKEYQALQERESEMEKLVHEFKNALLIEKIKMDTWENRKNNNGRP